MVSPGGGNHFPRPSPVLAVSHTNPLERSACAWPQSCSDPAVRFCMAGGSMVNARTVGRAAAAVVLIIAATFASPSTAAADPISLTVTSGPTLQQTQNRPCVIGDPSCHNLGTFPFTRLAPHDGADKVNSPA